MNKGSCQARIWGQEVALRRLLVKKCCWLAPEWSSEAQQYSMGWMGIPWGKWKIIIWSENVEVIGVRQLQDNTWKGNQITVGWELNWKWEHRHRSTAFKKLELDKKMVKSEDGGMGDIGPRESSCLQGKWNRVSILLTERKEAAGKEKMALMKWEENNNWCFKAEKRTREKEIESCSGRISLGQVEECWLWGKLPEELGEFHNKILSVYGKE